MTPKAWLRYLFFLTFLSGFISILFYVPRFIARESIDNYVINGAWQSPKAGSVFHHFIRNATYLGLNESEKKQLKGSCVLIRDKDLNNCKEINELLPADLKSLTPGSMGFKDGISDSIFKVVLNRDRLGWSFDINMEDRGFIIFPVPFSKNWHLIEDITHVNSIQVNNGLLGMIVERGAHHVQVVYDSTPHIIAINIFIFLLSLLIVSSARKIFRFLSYLSKTLFNFIENRNNRFVVRILFFFVLVLTGYFYFYAYKSWSWYGDDLITYTGYLDAGSIWERLNLPFYGNQLRPVAGWLFFALIFLFKAHIWCYYVFNLIVQGLVTVVLAEVIFLFLSNRSLSILISLLYAFSPFSYYNIENNLVGGALEGCSMLFFSGSLFFIGRFVLGESAIQKRAWQLYKAMGCALFATLTHERYIVLLPFIALLALVNRGSDPIDKKRNLRFTWLILAEIIGYLGLKLILGLSIFKGTTSDMQFSVTDILRNTADSILCFLQLYSGPRYLVGINFRDLANSWQILLLISTAFSSFAIVYSFLYRRKYQDRGQIPNKGSARNWLILLIVMLLAPPIFQFRMELRWLQAPLAVFILLMATCYYYLPIKLWLRQLLLTAWVLVFLVVNIIYQQRGVHNLFYKESGRISEVFRNAVAKGLIGANDRRIFLMIKNENSERESEIDYALQGGAFFEVYMGRKVAIEFISIDCPPKSIINYQQAITSFNPVSDQLLFVFVHPIGSTFNFQISAMPDSSEASNRLH